MTDTLLETRGLTVRFGGVTALGGLDLHVRSGEMLGLIGPNGSGKTTFFNAVTGFVRAAGGSVRVAGNEITGLAPRLIAKSGIARTFQRLRLLLELSVFDNLMVGQHLSLTHGLWRNVVARSALRSEFERQRELATEVLRVFNAELPARLFQPARALSMIDRRRVEVCRALIGNPRLLLLDEPSAGMTPEETRALMADLLEIKKQRPHLGIVLIEHDMKVIEQVSDRCAVLDYGRKVCEGRYAEVAAHPDVRRAYLGED